VLKKGYKKLGLALGGGAALGAAHVGVLKALEELNIKPEFISGTSIGAFVAAHYAFGTPVNKDRRDCSEFKLAGCWRI